MANAQRGEVALDINGTTYTLVLNLNALAELQSLFSSERPVKVRGKGPDGKPIDRWIMEPMVPTLEDLERWVMAGSVKHVRAMFWAALRKHHRGITLDDAGDLLEATGEQGAAALKVLAGLSAPDPADVKELAPAATGRPRKAQARTRGTGGKLSSPRAPQA
jgi:hypothetical protein